VTIAKQKQQITLNGAKGRWVEKGGADGIFDTGTIGSLCCCSKGWGSGAGGCRSLQLQKAADQELEAADQKPEAADQEPKQPATEAAVQGTVALCGVVLALLTPEVVQLVKTKAAGAMEAAERKQVTASVATSMVL
jgi:hypothetical protein